MDKDDLLIILVAILLFAAMLYTLFFGGNRSRHGVGKLLEPPPDIAATVHPHRLIIPS